jgi:phenylalanyl-tRNA synthetase beta chain
MKLSELWLREWVSPKLDTAELAHRLTMAGLEVGAVEAVAPELKNVVVGEIRAMEPHPGADKLRVCRVAVGKGLEVQIVCGAANATVGMKAPVALPGAKLPNGTEIRAAQLRGVASAGMLCSAAELGLDDGADGLMTLDAAAPVGMTLSAHLELDDRTLEVDLTPNRGDCLSVAGVAREVAALTGARLKLPALRPVAAKSKRRLKVTLRAPKECPQYVGRAIEGIRADAVTPIWMRERLRRSGIRSIHPVVDVTNYVMLELGQPMHAFDLDRLTGAIQVRRARSGERIKLLDGKEYAVPAGALLIADDAGPLALAGIMGGAPSGVGSATKDIFLESAWFHPDAIAGRARALGLQTDSSQRFERGVDPQLQRQAIERATQLLVGIVGGKPGPVVEERARAQLPKIPVVSLRAARLERLLGSTIASTVVTSVLKRLGMAPKAVSGGWKVVPPSYRFDVRREVDVIEEVARINGYDKIPSRRPHVTMVAPLVPEARRTVTGLRLAMADRDYQEVVTYSFVDPTVQALIDPAHAPLKLANPISADMASMRTSLLPGLLKTVAYNLNRQQTRIRIFEVGRCFVPREQALDHGYRLGAAVTGNAANEQWGVSGRPVDFFDLKGDLEALAGQAGFQSRIAFEPGVNPVLHPGQRACLMAEGRRVGYLGAVHPEILEKLGIDQPVLVMEIDLEALQDAKLPVFRDISRFPAVRRDIAIVVDEAVPAGRILEKTADVAGKLLVNLELFDEYRGKGIDSGRKSLALALTFQDSSRTLKEEEVDTLRQTVVTALGAEFGAVLRQ